MLERSSSSGSGTPAARSSPRTPPRLYAGSVSPPTRVTSTRSTLSGPRTPTARASPRTPAEAARWYRLAAEQGQAGAHYDLGVMYANGEGVLKDSVLAHMWLNIAGANGNKDARRRRDKLERGHEPRRDHARFRPSPRLHGLGLSGLRSIRSAPQRRSNSLEARGRFSSATSRL